MLLQQQKTFQNGGRFMFEQRLVARFQPVVAGDEALVDGVSPGNREDARTHGLQQHGIELQYFLLGAVVALHQVFAGAALCAGRDAELFGECGLVFEHQTVIVPAGKIMQADAQVLQQAFVARDLARLGRGDEAGLRQRLPGMAEAAGARDPQHGLQVAQAPRAFLQVRFQVVVGIDEAGMALLLFLRLGEVEGAVVKMRGERLVHLPEQPAVAGDMARFQQVGLHGHVRRFGEAIGNGAHAVADFQPDVPQFPDQLLQLLLQRFVRLLRQQDEQVDVGLRVELGAAVAAHCDQRQIGGEAEQPPDLAQMVVEQSGVGAQIVRGAGMREVLFLQRTARMAQTVAYLCYGHRRGSSVRQGWVEPRRRVSTLRSRFP